tara:strand:+ start:50 stop:274 length:225 start_codon:yes stop_codon:yes gene_type:complete
MIYNNRETLLKTILQNKFKVEIFIGTNENNEVYFVSYFSENNKLVFSIEQSMDQATWSKHFKLAKWCLKTRSNY